MDVNVDMIVNTISTKNFNKFVVWSKGWGKALQEFGKLVESLEDENHVEYSKKLTELKICSHFKKENITPNDVESFFNQYRVWASSVNLPAPQLLNAARKRKISAILRNFSDPEITEVFAKASRSKFIMANNFFTIDWITNLTNFLKVLEGNYDDKNTSLFEKDGF